MDSNAAKAALEAFKPTSSADFLTQAQDKYGVNDVSSRVDALRGLTDNLTKSIAAVDPSVTGRTSGSLVTEAQRSALVNRERQPLLGSLNEGNVSLNRANSDLTNRRSLAQQLASSLANDEASKYSKLKTTYDLARQQEQDALAKQNSDRNFQLSSQKASSGGGSGGGSTVDPAQEFLAYIDSQMKASGGAGNAKTSRQTQDAWANAWFTKNGVSNANRQGYWDLFNKTYNRSSDPTKDWRYTK